MGNTQLQKPEISISDIEAYFDADIINYVDIQKEMLQVLFERMG